MSRCTPVVAAGEFMRQEDEDGPSVGHTARIRGPKISPSGIRRFYIRQANRLDACCRSRSERFSSRPRRRTVICSGPLYHIGHGRSHYLGPSANHSSNYSSHRCHADVSKSGNYGSLFNLAGSGRYIIFPLGYLFGLKRRGPQQLPHAV